MLSQLKNAQSAGLETIAIPFSEMKLKIAEILKSKGYIEDFEKKKKKGRKAELDFLSVKLKYNGSQGAISGIKLVSKPSRRIYLGKGDMKPVMSGYGISVVSTPKGLMTGNDAKKIGIGGEELFKIW